MHSTLKMLKHLLISCPVDKMQVETDVPRTNYFKRLGLTQSFFLMPLKEEICSPRLRLFD